MLEILRTGDDCNMNDKLTRQKHRLARLGLKHSEETKTKLSEIMKQIANRPEWKERNRSSHIGLNRSEETRAKMRLARALRPPISEETRAKMRLAQKMRFSRPGSKNPMLGIHRFGSKNPMFGKHHSKETIEKIRQTKLERRKARQQVV
jgi:hypothetical protein